MKKIKEQIKKELTEIEEKGINTSNLELVGKLAEIYKDLSEIEKMDKGGQEMQEYGRYREGGGGYGAYRDGGYNARGGGYREGGGGGGYSEGGGYREGGYNEGYGRRRYSRMRDHMDRMMDGVDQYEYGKERYMHGGDDERVMEGLEKIMYAVCMFVESAMDYADSPQEKELIRKHIQKIKSI